MIVRQNGNLSTTLAIDSLTGEEQSLTPPGSTLNSVPTAESARLTHVDVGNHTERQVKVDPSGNEHAIKMPMGNDKDVARAFTLFEIQAVILTNLGGGVSPKSGSIYRLA